MFEFRVRFCNGVWAYDQFLRQGSNPGKLIAIPECTTLNAMPDLLHDLQVKGLPRSGYCLKKHG